MSGTAVPSVKGSIFAIVVGDTRELLDAGRISHDELETALDAPYVELLDQKILESSWYPLAAYAQLIEFLCHKTASGDEAYYLRRGERSADRLKDGGIYHQLELIGDLTEPSEREGPDAEARAMAAYRSKMNVIVSLAGSIYNVGKWQVLIDPDHPGRVCIEISQASDYSRGMMRAIEGFLDGCARAVRPEIEKLWHAERPSPDLIRFRMVKDVRQLRNH